MSTPGSGESYSSPNVEQLLVATLNQVRTAVGSDLGETLLPEGTTLLGVRTELYQSPTLETGRDVMPGHYPVDDRNLIILTLQNNKQVFLVGGKINPTDPFNMDNALGGGVDLREVNQTAYAYDGAQTITEYMQDGSTNNYTGEYGDPGILLSHIRYTLGACVAFEAVGVDPSA